MKNKVLGLFNPNDTINWCYCEEEDEKILFSILKKYYRDENYIRCLIKNDIKSVKYNGYIKSNPIKSRKPYTSLKALFKELLDDIDYFIIYDPFFGWKKYTKKMVQKSLKKDW